MADPPTSLGLQVLSSPDLTREPLLCKLIVFAGSRFCEVCLKRWWQFEGIVAEHTHTQSIETREEKLLKSALQDLGCSGFRISLSFWRNTPAPTCSERLLCRCLRCRWDLGKNNGWRLELSWAAGFWRSSPYTCLIFSRFRKVPTTTPVYFCTVETSFRNASLK